MTRQIDKGWAFQKGRFFPRAKVHFHLICILLLAYITTMDDKIKICFDKEYRIRVLDPEKSARAEELQQETGIFGES